MDILASQWPVLRRAVGAAERGAGLPVSRTPPFAAKSTVRSPEKGPGIFLCRPDPAAHLRPGPETATFTAVALGTAPGFSHDSRTRPFRLDILLLDPDSSYVDVLEKRAYPDKPEGFVAEEIRTNLEAIGQALAHLSDSSLVSIRCWLYQKRPNFRVTMLGDERSIVAHYFPKSRTGSETVFFDLHGPQAKHYISEIRSVYEQVKDTAIEVKFEPLE